MTNRRGSGLLAQIEAGVVDHKVPLSSLLQSCIVLGGQAGSEKMRDWARQELHGYAGAETVPEYRHVPVALTARITNRGGYNGITQRFDDSVFDPRIRDMIREKVDVQDGILSQGIGQLEAMANEDTEEQRLVPEWAGFVADVLNQHHMAPNSRVADVYWSVPRTAIQGVLVRIRTALADLVAELVALTPRDQEVPDKLAADQVIQFLLTGDRNVINYSPQHATGGGTNVTASGAAPVAVTGSQTASGAGSSVTGTQAASGEGSSVTSGQAVHAGRDAIAAGRDSTVSSADSGEPVKESWWASLRKRGVVTTISIIVSAIAAVAIVVVTIALAAGWKP